MNILDIESYYKSNEYLKTNKRIYLCKYYGLNKNDIDESFFPSSIFNSIEEARMYISYILKTIEEDEEDYKILDRCEDCTVIYIPSKRETQYIMIEEYIV